MKKKIFIIFTILILCLCIALGIVFLLKNKNKIINNDNNVIQNDTQQNNVQEENTTTEGLYVGEEKFNIKSTESNPIKFEEIEAINVDINKDGNNLEVITTLKNNSNSKIEGFMAVIELLDKDGNVVTLFAKNTEDEIQPNGTYKLMNYIPELKSEDKIVNARIKSFNKNIKANIEENLNNIKQN